jgi:hypothetical protein
MVKRFSMYNCFVGCLSAFPNFITIHAIKTPHDRGNFFISLKMLLQLFEVVHSIMLPRITPVSKQVKIYFFNTLLMEKIQERKDMLRTGVRTVVVRQKTHHMHRGAIFFDVMQRFMKSIIFIKRAVFNSVRNIKCVLLYDTTSS